MHFDLTTSEIEALKLNVVTNDYYFYHIIFIHNWLIYLTLYNSIFLSLGSCYIDS